MANRGHLALPYDTLRKLLGLPKTVEIIDVIVLPHREAVQFRLASTDPVPGLTSPTAPMQMIDEADGQMHALYLGEYYEQIFLAMSQHMKDTVVGQQMKNTKEGPING